MCFKCGILNSWFHPNQKLLFCRVVCVWRCSEGERAASEMTRGRLKQLKKWLSLPLLDRYFGLKHLIVRPSMRRCPCAKASTKDPSTKVEQLAHPCMFLFLYSLYTASSSFVWSGHLDTLTHGNRSPWPRCLPRRATPRNIEYSRLSSASLYSRRESNHGSQSVSSRR